MPSSNAGRIASCFYIHLVFAILKLFESNRDLGLYGENSGTHLSNDLPILRISCALSATVASSGAPPGFLQDVLSRALIEALEMLKSSFKDSSLNPGL